jgi:hypothetical protein
VLRGKNLVRQHLLRRLRALTEVVGLLIPRVLAMHYGTHLNGLAAAVLAVLSVIFLFVVAVNVLLVNHLTQLFFVTTERSRR